MSQQLTDDNNVSTCIHLSFNSNSQFFAKTELQRVHSNSVSRRHVHCNGRTRLELCTFIFLVHLTVFSHAWFMSILVYYDKHNNWITLPIANKQQPSTSHPRLNFTSTYSKYKAYTSLSYRWLVQSNWNNSFKSVVNLTNIRNNKQLTVFWATYFSTSKSNSRCF